jgi:uncharacterized iron-regulated membrane protein
MAVLGAIAGSAVGGAAAIVIAVGGVWLWMKRKAAAGAKNRV